METRSPKDATNRESSRIGTAILATTDLFYPPRCTSCGEECASRAGQPLFCQICDEEFGLSARPACPRCALALSDVEPGHADCWSCRGRKLLFRETRTIGPYQGPLREAVLKMKHSQCQPLATALGLRLAEALIARPLPANPDEVAAVPMHWLKRLWRGSNPAETAAKSVAQRLNLRFSTGLLVCLRYLRRQATLSPVERRRNVRGAFRVSRRWNIQGRSILVVDDVMTTGATAQEAARALLAAGASQIFVATMARSSPDV